MDQALLYSQMMGWIISTLIPILAIVSPVAIYLHMAHKNTMDSKVDSKIFEATIEPIRKDVDEIKQNNLALKSEIMDELKYIRNRVDTLADKP